MKNTVGYIAYVILLILAGVSLNKQDWDLVLFDIGVAIWVFVEVHFKRD